MMVLILYIWLKMYIIEKDLAFVAQNDESMPIWEAGVTAELYYYFSAFGKKTVTKEKKKEKKKNKAIFK